MTQGTTMTYTFTYNGDGARLKQKVNSTVTTYTVDLAAGLTQVLVDVTSGVTNTYEYGNGRIAQNNSGGGTSYLLGDALGSVRQLADQGSAVILTKSYQPYGGVLSTSGSGSSAYGFTGEWTDNTGLGYLRARYYAPGQGRFVSRDTWAGDYTRPLTLNGFGYSLSNPVNYTDPSGNDAMFVGGYTSNDWANPGEWKDWGMAYKDWTEDQWNRFVGRWRQEDKQKLMDETGIHFFNWNNLLESKDIGDSFWGTQEASSKAPVDNKAMDEVSTEMGTMMDITLVGYSKGANLVLNYLQNLSGRVRPKNAVLIDAPVVDFVWLSGSKLALPSVVGSGVHTVNLFNPIDPINYGLLGFVCGAANIPALNVGDKPVFIHGIKGQWAKSVLNNVLLVGFDRGAREELYTGFSLSQH